jgi:hypothetical protein
MRLLVSMCNLGVFNSQYSLASVDVDARGGIELVDCRSFLNPGKDTGINGLCRVGDMIAVGIQSNVPRVALLDLQLNLIAAIEHPNLSDLHSLMPVDGQLYVVCTGNNKILKIDPADRSVSTVWEYHIDEPCLHINSLAFHDGRMLVSSHSLPAEARAKGQGGCWYTDTYEVLIPGLRQPHSLTAHGDSIYCLSSQDSRVVAWKGGALTEHQVRGYLRGMLVADDVIYIASSSGRFVSRKQAGVQVFVDFDEVIGNPKFMSEMVVCDLDFKPKRRVNITHVGFELYDVVEDPGVPDSLKAKPAAAVRMQTMFRQNVFFREQLQKFRKKAKG